jgi:uncharacterized protein YegL
MAERPGSVLAGRPLHFFVLADCSGSMASDGKIAALNTALRETLPHLRVVAASNPHAEVLVRVVRFASGASWHIETPTRVDDVVWVDLDAAGYTDLGAGIDLIASQLDVPPMPARALPPVIVLVSDGQPTDDWAGALERLESRPWGAHAVRMAVGIGRDADPDVLAAFIGDADLPTVTASNPEQLVAMIRWASVHASRVASTVGPAGSTLTVPAANGTSEMVW